MAHLYKTNIKKHPIFLAFLLVCCISFSGYSQNIDVYMQGLSVNMSNGWNGNCDSDCSSSAPDWRVRYNFSCNSCSWMTNHEVYYENTNCGWRGVSGTQYISNISSGALLQTGIGGREDDSGLSGGHDGDCLGVAVTGTQPSATSIGICT